MILVKNLKTGVSYVHHRLSATPILELVGNIEYALKPTNGSSILETLSKEGIKELPKPVKIKKKK